MSKCKWLDSLQNSERIIKEVAWELSTLSSAFRKTGNEIVADQLLVERLTLEEEAENIRRATGQAVNDWTGAIEQGAFNMLSTALVISDMKKDEGERDSDK